MDLLVIHQGALGDFILTLSVIQAVHAHLKPSRVEVIAPASSARLAAGRSVVDGWLSPESVGLHTLFGSRDNLDTRLADRLQHAQWVLSFLGERGGAVDQVLRAATAGQVVSVEPRPVAETLAGKWHITSQWAQAVRRGGWSIDDPSPPRIHLRETPGESQRTVVKPAACGVTEGLPSVIIHPGSGGLAKCWPTENFFLLADLLSMTKVCWMLGAAECERQDYLRGELSRRQATNNESLIICPDLLEAAQWIAGADLYVGNDSGITHLAAALGTPTSVLFITTDPDVWRPLGDHVTVWPGSTDPAKMAFALKAILR